ncbi:rhodanese-like domain-containing protein [Sulfurimonas sp.]|nr:rhodanese-like domain-containing protein [Sulfurimonas sp.]
MKKTFFILLFLSSSLLATIINQEVSQKLIDSTIPIVDIRTPMEWKETGLVKNSIPIMLFDEKGNYNLGVFIDKLNKAVDTTKPFAIICRTGSRTVVLATFLSKRLNYTVINLKSGIVYAKYKRLPFVKYNPVD